MNIKQQLYNKCQEFLDKRFQVIQKTILDIQHALQSETKSSAGDKHETGRAMLQLEREKAGHQLSELQKLKEILHRINPDITQEIGALGSIVKTSKSNYFIAISAGEIEMDHGKFYGISPATPIAKLLIGSKKGDKISFRDQKFIITSVL